MKRQVILGCMMVITAACADFRFGGEVEPRGLPGGKNDATKGIELQIDAFSDFHGQLLPTAVPGVGDVGGAAVLSAYFNADRAQNPNTLLLAGGDTFGASPPIANAFKEVPVVEALNLMGLTASAVGNHEFDSGPKHLNSQIELARYPYLSANLARTRDNLSCPIRARGCVAPFEIVSVGGVKVAIIGLTTPETATLVVPGNLGTVEIEDPVAAANQARAEAASGGAEVFVAIAHIGATPSAASAPIDGALRDGRCYPYCPSGAPNDDDGDGWGWADNQSCIVKGSGQDRNQPCACAAAGVGATGALIDLASQISGFDLIIGGHSHNQINTEVKGVPVIETKSQGVEYFRVSLRYDPAARAVTGHSVTIVTPVAQDVTPDPAIVNLLAPYQKRLNELFDSPIATAAGLFERGNNVERLRETAIGDLLADALRKRYDADIGFMNGGGIRAPLPSSYTPADLNLRRSTAGYRQGPPYDLVVGDVFSVLPFGGNAVMREVTGEKLWQILEHSVEYLPAPKGGFGQVSGIRFSFDSSKPARSRLVSVTRTDGTPVAPDLKRYSLVTSDYIGLGGDDYTMLTDVKPEVRDPLIDIFLSHLKSCATLNPTVEGRIKDLAH